MLTLLSCWFHMAAAAIKIAAAAAVALLLLFLHCPSFQAQLKPRFQSKQLDSEDCKWILSKVTDKVMSATTASDLDRGGDFVNAKREKKVAALIDSYVAKRKQERKGAAADAPAGDGKAAGAAEVAAAAGQDRS
jgi:hypothetical protein